MKKKFVSLFIIICFAFLSIVFLFDYRKKDLIKDIKSHYSTIIKIENGKKIYIKKNNKYVEIGNIYAEVYFNLEKIDKLNENNKYFKIKNSDYYIYYLDCIKDDNNDNNNIFPDKYVKFNKNVLTIDETLLKKNGEKIINIKEGINLPLLYQDNDYYYVSYLDDIYGIAKEKSELIDSENTNQKISEYISVLHYKNIEENNCQKRNCITIPEIEDTLKTITNNDFYTISENEFIEWNSNNLQLKEKSLMIIVDNDEFIKDLFDNYNLIYFTEKELSNMKIIDDYNSNTNYKSLDQVSSYLITENNYDEIIKTAMEGKKYQVFYESKTLDNSSVATNIAVLNYHFFYDRAKGEKCNESICLEASIFEEQLKYLRDNGYKTLTIDEFKDWMYGNIELPKKSVLLTVDDGAKGTGLHNGNILIPLLERYQVNATLFLISGWWGVENYQSKYLDIQSHTWDMHNYMTCEDGTTKQQLICSSYDDIINDLTHSLNDVDSDTSFCFPFYVYNDTSLKAVKDMGFKLAFVGGGYKASRSNDKYLIPRYPIYDGISLNQFINYIN